MGYGPTVMGIIKKIGHSIDNAPSVRLMMPLNVMVRMRPDRHHQCRCLCADSVLAY
jgi:hypothetical protein